MATPFSRNAVAALAILSLAAVSAHAQDLQITEPPQDFKFDKAALHSTVAARKFSLLNRGGTAVALEAASFNGRFAVCMGMGCPVAAPSDFSIPSDSDGCSNTTLPPGQSCSALVVFSPTAVGARAARLVFPVRGGSTVERFVEGTGQAQPTDCVLDWAESMFRAQLAHPSPTFTMSPFYLRCYSSATGSICLGADAEVPTLDQPSVYLYQPQATPAVQRLGYLSAFAAAAQCR